MSQDRGTVAWPPAVPGSRAQEASLRDLFRVLFRWRRTVGVVFLAALGTAGLVTFLSPPKYRSDAKLLVRLGRESVVLDPTAAVGEVVNIQQTRQNEINSELAILRSRELVESLVQAVGPENLGSPGLLERLGLSTTQSAVDRAVEQVLDDLRIEVLKETNIILLSYMARSPELAQEVVSKIIDLYLDKHIAAHRTSGSYAFFATETQQLRDAIETAEAQLRDIKNRSNIGALDEQLRIVLGRIGALQQEIEQNNTGLSASRARIRKLRRMLKDLPETIVTEQTSGLPNSGAEGMRQSLYELQLKEQDILSKFHEDSAPAREVRRQIEEAEALLRQEKRERVQVTQGLNASHQKVKADLLAEETLLSGLEARSSALRQELKSARGELQTLNTSEVDMARLQRELDSARENYRRYTDNLEQARIDQALETERISNISVVQPATLIRKVVSPRKGLNLVIGLLLGLFGGVGLAFVREYLDQTFRRPVDVMQRLHVPVLVAIPRMPVVPAGAAALKGAPELLPESAGAALQKGAGPRKDTGLEKRATPGLVPMPKREIYFEALHDYLTLSANGHFKGPCVLAVTGCRKGEGVTTIAASLAATLRRETRGRVLLLDAHRLRPAGQDGGFDLDACEVGPDGAFVPVVGTWRARTTPDLMDELKRQFNFVVLDTPAVLETSAAVRLCGMADGVILVVEAENTRWQVAQEAQEALKRANASVLGVVLNKRRFHVPEWLYQKL